MQLQENFKLGNDCPESNILGNLEMTTDEERRRWKIETGRIMRKRFVQIKRIIYVLDYNKKARSNIKNNETQNNISYQF